MSGIDELFASAPPSRKRGCAICGAANVASVSVQIRRLDEAGQLGSGTVTRSRSLCDTHAVSVWDALVAELKAAT